MPNTKIKFVSVRPAPESFVDRRLRFARAEMQRARRNTLLLKKHRSIIEQCLALPEVETTNGGDTSYDGYSGERGGILTLHLHLREQYNRDNSMVIALAKLLEVQGIKATAYNSLRVTFTVSKQFRVVVSGYIPNTCTIITEKRMVTREETTQRVVCTDAEGNVQS